MVARISLSLGDLDLVARVIVLTVTVRTVCHIQCGKLAIIYYYYIDEYVRTVPVSTILDVLEMKRHKQINEIALSTHTGRLKIEIAFAKIRSHEI
jgi:hypothetical protein